MCNLQRCSQYPWSCNWVDKQTVNRDREHRNVFDLIWLFLICVIWSYFIQFGLKSFEINWGKWDQEKFVRRKPIFDIPWLRTQWSWSPLDIIYFHLIVFLLHNRVLFNREQESGVESVFSWYSWLAGYHWSIKPYHEIDLISIRQFIFHLIVFSVAINTHFKMINSQRPLNRDTNTMIVNP